MEVEAPGGARHGRRFPRRRSRLLEREPAEDPEWWLVPTPHRRRGVHRDDDVEQRSRAARLAARRALDVTRGAVRANAGALGGTRRGDGSLSWAPRRGRTAGAAAQPPLQQGRALAYR